MRDGVLNPVYFKLCKISGYSSFVNNCFYNFSNKIKNYQQGMKLDSAFLSFSSGRFMFLGDKATIDFS